MADFLGQINATILPLTSIDNLVMIIGTVTAAAYFIFTAQTEGPYKYVNQTGRIFLLAAFGVTYGQTVSFRFELVIGRLVDMLRPEVAIYTYVMLLLVALGLGYGYYTKKIKWYSGR
jgi:formate hydrogenlyase subunit 3/multisubunit Na+/H+ antiporter MnhD subunit